MDPMRFRLGGMQLVLMRLQGLFYRLCHHFQLEGVQLALTHLQRLLHRSSSRWQMHLSQSCRFLIRWQSRSRQLLVRMSSWRRQLRCLLLRLRRPCQCRWQVRQFMKQLHRRRWTSAASRLLAWKWPSSVLSWKRSLDPSFKCFCPWQASQLFRWIGSILQAWARLSFQTIVAGWFVRTRGGQALVWGQVTALLQTAPKHRVQRCLTPPRQSLLRWSPMQRAEQQHLQAQQAPGPTWPLHQPLHQPALPSQRPSRQLFLQWRPWQHSSSRQCL